MSGRITATLIASLLVCVMFGSQPLERAVAQDKGTVDVDAVVSRGMEFLRAQQADDGTFSREAGPGITALAITGALRCGEPLASPMVQKGLAALKTFIKPDGGIYGNGRLRNYETCIAIICFAEANKNGEFNSILQDAKRFVTSIQYGVGTESGSEELWQGGVGYAGQGRPDLSNTAYLIEALRALDAGADDPNIQAALAFVSRCQNLESPHNSTVFADKINDGSFYYEIPTEKIDPSSDPERYTPEGGLRGYGTITYAGYKSMIYAGLTPEDPRVAAALQWISATYTVENNPNMGQAGLYYYYQTFSTALEAAKLETINDADNQPRNWREDLAGALAKRQNSDGSWSNENRRWLENEKNLATSFALLALANCRSRTDSNR